MKKFIFLHKEFLIGFLLSLSLLWPLFSAPFFTHHDDVQVIRLYEMDKCFKDHQIPCRWVPDLGGLYGYPLFNYYAPLPYYFGELIYSITHTLTTSVKVMFGFAFLGSYVFMYVLGKKLWGKTGGVLSGVFYSFAPYHGVDFYVRGAMGEMWGLMLFPAIFWALLRLEEKPAISNLLLVALSVGALLTSHNLSALIFLPFALVWALLLFFKNHSKRFLIFGGLSLGLGVMLSAFYLLPVTVEKNLVHVDTTISGYFSYTEHFKGLRKLFIQRSWGWGASVREIPGGEKDDLSFQIGWVHLLGWILSLFAAKTLWNKKRWLALVIIFSSFSMLFAVFMVHPRSEFIWRSIESLKYLQFPWRFLMLIIFFISLSVGSIIFYPVKKIKYLPLILLLLVVGLNFFYFRPEKFIQTDDEKLLSGQNWDRQIKRSIFDYLPIFAKEPPAELATERYKILTGDTKVYDFYEGTNWFTFKTHTNSHTIIRLSQYYFPNWEININGKKAVFEYKNNSLGLMTIILGEGDHKIDARLYDTQIRSFSNALTAVAFVITLILFIVQFSKVRSWIGYYRKRIN